MPAPLPSATALDATRVGTLVRTLLVDWGPDGAGTPIIEIRQDDDAGLPFVLVLFSPAGDQRAVVGRVATFGMAEAGVLQAVAEITGRPDGPLLQGATGCPVCR